jgi:hypothetical protein
MDAIVELFPTRSRGQGRKMSALKGICPGATESVGWEQSQFVHFNEWGNADSEGVGEAIDETEK